MRPELAGRSRRQRTMCSCSSCGRVGATTAQKVRRRRVRQRQYGASPTGRMRCRDCGLHSPALFRASRPARSGCVWARREVMCSCRLRLRQRSSAPCVDEFVRLANVSVCHSFGMMARGLLAWRMSVLSKIRSVSTVCMARKLTFWTTGVRTVAIRMAVGMEVTDIVVLTECWPRSGLCSAVH